MAARVAYQFHITCLQEEVDEIVQKQEVLEESIQELKQKAEDFRLLSERKYKIQAAIEHLKDLVEVAPDVQEALHPKDPFGEAG